MQLLPRLEMESDLLRHGDTPSLELRFRPRIRINIKIKPLLFDILVKRKILLYLISIYLS